jgi:mRNA interferase RelE/StbE
VGYTVSYHPSVKEKDLPKLDVIIKTKIKKAIETKLITAPDQYGAPLRRTLKGYWKLRVGDYRVVFKIKSNEIVILAILHRKDVYNVVPKNGK